MRNKFLLWALVLVINVSLASPISAISEKEAAMSPPASVDFALPTLTGDSFKLSSYRGKKVLAIFWASW